ncbi:hypothetical protein [Sanguibacter antarcticus]|uniref:hypothetical protein n=1 Tax=Sanguibacter antarcticus TaxID=372484 RepID=UPI00117AEBA4|nr:hypothetical protein [Sanguibacter antarcticus]
MSTGGDLQEPEHDPWHWGTWLIVGGTVIAGILVVFAASGSGDDELDAPIDWSFEDPSDTHPNQGALPVLTDPNQSACELVAGDQSVPTEPPAATWERVDEVMIPTDSAIGPGLTENTMHTCYAHSPVGALFAAVGMVADQHSFGDRTMLEGRTVREPRVIEAISRTAAQTSDSTSPGAPQITGYRFVDVAADRVTLDLALLTSTDPSASRTSSATTVVLQWSDHDWLAVMQPSETIWSEMRPLTEPSNFVALTADQR